MINCTSRIFIACCLNITFFASAIEITIAYEDKEQPPFYMVNSLLIPTKKPGVSVEMIKRLGQMIEGLEINLIRCPWKRCLYSLKNNLIDGVFNASYKQTRLDIGWYPTKNGLLEGPVDLSKRIAFISYSFYTLNNSGVKWDGVSISNVDKRTIGAPRGYSVVTDLQRKGFLVDESPSTKSNLEKLILGRINVVALQDVTADSVIGENPKTFSNIKKLQPPFITKAYYLMLSHSFVQKHPKIAQQMWEAIKLIRETEFNNIVTKYNND